MVKKTEETKSTSRTPAELIERANKYMTAVGVKSLNAVKNQALDEFLRQRGY